MSSEVVQRESLRKTLGRLDVLALAFGTLVGWGWVMLSAGWVETAGVLGAVIALTVGGIMCMLVGATYAELTPALPLAGGELVYAYRGLGYFWSWFSAWAICLAYVGVAAWEGIAIATAVNWLAPFPQAVLIWTVNGSPVYLSWAAVGSIGAAIIMVINLLGIKQSSVFQAVSVTGLLAAGVIFFTGGTVFGSAANAEPLFSGVGTVGPMAGIMAVMMMAPGMFVGFDVIPQAAEEMKIPAKQIAGVIYLSILMGIIWYVAMILGASMGAPADVRDSFSGSVPVAEIAAYALGSKVWGQILIVGGICGIVSSWNGFFIGASRIIFSMGRAKMLPAVFGKVDPKHQAPTAAIILVGIICMITPLMGRNALVWFVDTASFGTVVAYFMVALAFLAIRKKEPDLERPYSNRYPTLAGILALAASLFFICLYLPFGPSSLVWPYEWVFVLFWAGLGVILAILGKRSNGPVSSEEREYLFFGETYARKEMLKDYLKGTK